MRKLIALSLALLATPLYAYTPGEYAIDISAQITAAHAACAGGEDADTNIYDAVGDWTSARVNAAAKIYHCVEEGDYSGHAQFNITRDGSSSQRRFLVYYDPDNAGEAATCGDGTFYETPAWPITRTGGFDSGDGAVNQQAADRAIFETLDISADYWTVFCLTLQDPNDSSNPSGGFSINNGSHHNILSHSLIQNIDTNLVFVRAGTTFNTIQYNVIRGSAGWLAGNSNFEAAEKLCVAFIVQNGVADNQNNVVTSNEIYDCASDSWQTLGVTDANSITAYHLGAVFENNDARITSAMYTDCATGDIDVNGACACAENAVDIKIALENGTTPREQSATQWSAGASISAGNIRRPTTYNGWYYIAQNAGTTHGTTQPTWPTVWRSEVTDNGIVWRAFHDVTAVLGNRISGFRASPTSHSASCPALGNSWGSAIDLHYTNADFVRTAHNIVADSQSGFSISLSGPGRLSVINNIFTGIGDKGTGGAGLNRGAMYVSSGSGIEAYYNLISASSGPWFTNGSAGTIDARANLVIRSGAGAVTDAGSSDTDGNGWIGVSGTATAGQIGTNATINVAAASRANSTAYTTGQLMVAAPNNGAVYEAQGNCTSASASPTYDETNANVDDDVSDGDCTFRVVQAPLTYWRFLWTAPEEATVPYGANAEATSASSPAINLPGDRNQGCMASSGVDNALPAGVTC